jgi:hypothetical protein
LSLEVEFVWPPLWGLGCGYALLMYSASLLDTWPGRRPSARFPPVFGGSLPRWELGSCCLGLGNRGSKSRHCACLMFISLLIGYWGTQLGVEHRKLLLGASTSVVKSYIIGTYCTHMALSLTPHVIKKPWVSVCFFLFLHCSCFEWVCYGLNWVGLGWFLHGIWVGNRRSCAVPFCHCKFLHGIRVGNRRSCAVPFCSGCQCGLLKGGSSWPLTVGQSLPLALVWGSTFWEADCFAGCSSKSFPVLQFCCVIPVLVAGVRRTLPRCNLTQVKFYRVSVRFWWLGFLEPSHVVIRCLGTEPGEVLSCVCPVVWWLGFLEPSHVVICCLDAEPGKILSCICLLSGGWGS